MKEEGASTPGGRAAGGRSPLPGRAGYPSSVSPPNPLCPSLLPQAAQARYLKSYEKTGENLTSQEEQQLASILSSEVDEARRLAVRENAKHVLRLSGLADMLRAINRDQLKGRGRFEEYDTIVLLRWGRGYTGRHLWIEVNGNTIRFRLPPHLKCTKPAPLCDGEYHIFTSSMWANRELLRTELDKYYAKPVAETSSD